MSYNCAVAQKVDPPTLSIRHAKVSGEVGAIAVTHLKGGLGAMGAPIVALIDGELRAPAIRIDWGNDTEDSGPPPELHDDSFAITRCGANSIRIDAGSERGLIHAAADLMEQLGAQFPPGAPPIFPHLDRAQLATLKSHVVAPTFKRRAFVSDIMTWSYTTADRLALHLEHDREFIPWMARRGINAFSYIRHAHDTRLRIDEIASLLAAHGIDAEYGGHVLQILMPREAFEKHPEYFPADEGGNRQQIGNLCASDPGAIELVRENALKYVRDFPENSLLHIWGADVRGGAWCRCSRCRELAPQRQYMEVVNAIADALGADATAPPVTYLAYHDTIEPLAELRPRPNVWFEWAPRERCYVHAINDAACEINPGYLDSLKRYLDLFEGRGHVFEYYADSILFGGLGFATPGVIAADLRCYRALGIESISCLTFGAFSALAYPVNLEAFVSGTRSADFAPEAGLAAVAAGRHPRCAARMSDAYRAMARASHLVLDYGDVHRVMRFANLKRARKRKELSQAAAAFAEAIAAADSIASDARDPIVESEKDLWRYSRDVLGGLSDYLAALEDSGKDRKSRGEAAIAKVNAAIEHIHRIELPLKGTWGAYDLEWLRELWLRGLRAGLEAEQHPGEELF